MQVLTILKEFFKSKTIGFYVTIAAIILSVVQAIIYPVAFAAQAYVPYSHWSTTVFAVIGIVGGAALLCFKKTQDFAPAVVGLFELLSFYMFIRYGYMYFSTLFFGGISLELIFQMYYGYLWSIILYLVTFVLCIVAIFTKKERNSAVSYVKEGKEA